MRLTPEQIEQQINEGELTVSGGKDNPPDRYEVATIIGLSDEEASTLLSNYADPKGGGFRVVAFNNGRVIMGNYKE